MPADGRVIPIDGIAGSKAPPSKPWRSSRVNFSAAVQNVFVFQPLLDGAGCGSAVIGGTETSLYMRLQPSQTAQLQFPTPLVVPIYNGSSCIAFSNTSAQVEVYVNGCTQ